MDYTVDIMNYQSYRRRIGDAFSCVVTYKNEICGEIIEQIYYLGYLFSSETVPVVPT